MATYYDREALKGNLIPFGPRTLYRNGKMVASYLGREDPPPSPHDLVGPTLERGFPPECRNYTPEQMLEWIATNWEDYQKDIPGKYRSKKPT